MVKSYKKFEIEPPPELFEKIVSRIQKEKRLASARQKIFIFSAGLFWSLVAFIPSYQIVRAELMQSGFFQFFSLIFSDLSVVVVYWQSFAFTLMESLPIMSLLAFFLVLFILFESAKHLTKNIKSALIYGY